MLSSGSCPPLHLSGRNLEVGRRLLRVFSHETGGDRKELAIKKVVAPRSKIRKSDKFFGIFFAKKFTQGFCLKIQKIPQPGNFL